MNVYIIAEIGNTHEGSVGLAKCFIKAVAQTGADAVKFQTHIFDEESLPNAPNPAYFKGESRKAYFERTSFTQSEWLELKKFAENEVGIDFISSPFSLKAVDVLEEINVKTYKIASGEVNNLPLLEKISRTGKKVLLSSGMSNLKELDLAVDILRSNGCKDLVLLQCTSEYPCPEEHAGLNMIEMMEKRYGLPVGFSDHTIGFGVPVASVCKGAVVVEKHFTLSQKMYGSDAWFATEPDDFAKLVEIIRSVEKALSATIDKDKKAIELKEMKKIFEKSIVAACDIPSGTILGQEHLAYKKPGTGISAKNYNQIIGLQTKIDIKYNQMIERGWLQKK